MFYEEIKKKMTYGHKKDRFKLLFYYYTELGIIHIIYVILYVPCIQVIVLKHICTLVSVNQPSGLPRQDVDFETAILHLNEPGSNLARFSRSKVYEITVDHYNRFSDYTVCPKSESRLLLEILNWKRICEKL